LVDGCYTPDGEAGWGVGRATLQSLGRYAKGVAPTECGGTKEGDNGNGSLMRILPILFYLDSNNIKVLSSEGIQVISDISSLTHAHARCRAACIIYLAVCEFILHKVGCNIDEEDAFEGGEGWVLYHDSPSNWDDDDFYAARNAQIMERLGIALNILAEYPEYRSELEHFARLRIASFPDTPRGDIQSSGYVVHTLEAALWCFLNAKGFDDAVLAAANLGDDADTTAAVCGGLAGIFSTRYSRRDGSSERSRFLKGIVKRDGIDAIVENLSYALGYNEEDICEKVKTNKDTWGHEPIHKPKLIVLPEPLRFSTEQLEFMKEGIYPYEMEDKWFAYYDSSHFYFHRSWTGKGIYAAAIEQEGDEHLIRSFIVEADKDVFRRDNDDNNVMDFLFLVYSGLLWMPIPDAVFQYYSSAEESALRSWSSFGNMMFGGARLVDE
jgi:ADP-ribosylglycohydrolase